MPLNMILLIVDGALLVVLVVLFIIKKILTKKKKSQKGNVGNGVDNSSCDTHTFSVRNGKNERQ